MTRGTKTDLMAGTLSDKDRADFLQAWEGLAVETPKEEAELIRQKWTDEKILMAIGSGLF